MQSRAWLQSDGTRINVWASGYAPGGSWSTPTLIGTDNAGDARDVVLVVGSWGNAIAAWAQFDGTRDNIWANRRLIGGRGGWDTAVLLETDDTGRAFRPAVAMNDAGSAVAVWCQSDGTRFNLWANHYTTGRSRGTATLIESDNAGNADQPRVGMDSSGNALVLWSQSDGVRTHVWANRSSAAGNWQQSDGTRLNIWANHFSAGNQRWGTATLIENDNAGDASGPVVAMNSAGSASALWNQSDGATQHLGQPLHDRKRLGNTYACGTRRCRTRIRTCSGRRPVGQRCRGVEPVRRRTHQHLVESLRGRRRLGTPTLIERNDRNAAFPGDRAATRIRPRINRET